MSISQILNQKRPSISFEFFPAKTEKSSAELVEAIQDLQSLDPSFVSVTYGAGGGTRERTHDLLLKIKQETHFPVVSHLTCVGHTQEEVFAILQRYDAAGITNIMALRGDPPQGKAVYEMVPGGFPYAKDLVALIKKEFPHMGIGVAGFPEGHPECPNRLKEMDYLKEKIDAGADYICTQLFFENNDFYDFCERCEIAGIRIPILAGIMPITSRRGMKRMSELALGARYPAKLLKAMARAEDDDYAEKVGIHWATGQVMDLINHDVRGIHFYTLNKSRATKTIVENLGVSSSRGLEALS